jgi:hypothetical protein
MIHKLKSWNRFYRDLRTCERTHELRLNDRDYKVGDFLDLHDYDPVTMEYSGARLLMLVTSITQNGDAPCAVSPYALNDEFCIMSVSLVAEFAS